MKILLDTHCWLWANATPEKLGLKALEILRRTSTQIYISAGSVWEIAIKVKLGKLKLGEPVAEYVRRHLKNDQLIELPISAQHCAYIAQLPDLHRDPFDRILISQSFCEGLTLMTVDEQIARYSVRSLSARE